MKPRYYLSLGDSLAVGEQPDADGVGHPTDEGYADRLHGIASAWLPDLRLVKLGCGGERAETMVEGGSTCTYETGSQLGDAIAFLATHRDSVAFVTLDIGWNDFPCHDSPECVLPGVEKIAAYLPQILTRLRDAAGPAVPIVGATIYDPILAAWLRDDAGRQMAVDSVPIVRQVNEFVGSIYAAAGMPVADIEGAFATADWTPAPDRGDMPVNVLRVCEWTWLAAPPPVGPNTHPNPAGYIGIARAFADALEPIVTATAGR